MSRKLRLSHARCIFLELWNCFVLVFINHPRYLVAFIWSKSDKIIRRNMLGYLHENQFESQLSLSERDESWTLYIGYTVETLRERNISQFSHARNKCYRRKCTQENDNWQVFPFRQLWTSFPPIITPKFVFDIRGIVVKRPKNQINADSRWFDRFFENDKSLIKFLEFVLSFGKCFGFAIMNQGRSETLLLGNSLSLPRS